MTFKEKHVLPLVLTAAMTMSCGENKLNLHNDKEDNNMGLLDERPLKDTDKYDASVMLYQVDIPVYNQYGDRIEGQSVLTRGLRNSSYSSPQNFENMSIKEVYLNGNSKPCYVKADMNNAIYTEKGFSGLFIDYNRRAAIVADKNITQFITELGERKSRQRIKNEQTLNTEIRKTTENNIFKNVAQKDTLVSDSVDVEFEHKDTIKSDTVSTKNIYSDTQFLDTLRSINQR